MKIGLDKVRDRADLLQNFGKIGLVTHQAVTTTDFEPAVQVIERICSQNSINASLVAIFSPQHGYKQTEQDNMFETPDSDFLFKNGKTIPLFSLYSAVRSPKSEQLALIDTLLVDMPDIGCRVYTYIQTLANCLEVASKFGKKVVVLDRPNPVGLSRFDSVTSSWENVEGNTLDLKYASFVGSCPIPLRHGLTLGEFGKYYINFKKLDVDYEVVKVDGLTRNMSLREIATSPFVLPSPNMPTWEAALWFSGFVVLEATNVSEGRGTTMPFQIVGAPWLKHEKLSDFLNKTLANCGLCSTSFVVRPHSFRPTFNKYSGEVCNGVQFHCLNPDKLSPFAIGMAFLFFCLAEHPKSFNFKAPGYEYNFNDSPEILILGDLRWKQAFTDIQANGLTNSTETCMTEILAWSKADAQKFARGTTWAHLYN